MRLSKLHEDHAGAVCGVVVKMRFDAAMGRSIP